MKKLLLIVATVAVLMSCENGKSSKDKKAMLPDSTGKLNTVSLVLDNESWKGSVGEAVRDVLTASILGLPQDEAMFGVNQIPPHVFTDYITKNRTVLMIKTGKPSGIFVKNDVYAKPQRVIVVSGETKQDVIKVLQDNDEKIRETFKGIELKHRQKMIKKSLYNAKEIRENLGLNINFPTAYRIGKTIAKKEDKFYWIKKDIPTGYTNVLLYELPLSAIKKDTSVVSQIAKIRDSIGKKYIEGPVEGSHMITEYAFTPFHTETILDNKPTIETRGMWEVKNAFMAGPYINYLIEDEINKRWIVLEGFTYAPSVAKRNYMFDLEAIIKSVKIQ